MRLPRFRTIRGKLAFLYAGLFVAAMLLLGVAAQAMIERHASETVQKELAASEQIYDRLWSARIQTLSDQADVLARDFGFRDALATGDAPTIASAAANLNQRACATFTLVVTPDGQVIGDVPPLLRGQAADLPFAFVEGRGTAVIASGNAPFQIVVRPVLAPTEIGWIIFAVRLDQGEMRSLEKLSAIPLKADVMWRGPKSEWQLQSARGDEQRKLTALTRKAGAAPQLMRLGGEEVFVVVKPLNAVEGQGAAILVIRYALASAMAGFRPLQVSILFAALIGLLLVIIASTRLARSIAQPISELEDAARSLAQGDRVDVPVRGDDEIARLAQRFNSMAKEITEREHRISHMALNDALTGLPNRVFFREQLDTRLRRLRELDSYLSILSLDLDGFKHVNDTLGHPFGDKLLIEVSRRLSKIMPDAFVSRLGGDEFAIILDEDCKSDQSMRHSRKVIEAIQRPFVIDGQQALIGTSIGIAIAPSDGTSADALLKNADLALYRAKQDGRGVFRFFEPALNDEAQYRRQLEIDLREALLLGQFELHFQPIFAAEGRQVVCFEALLRWNHPKRSLIGPNQFVRVAEESGLMLRIGEWVLQEACRRAHDWPGHIRVAVNVSPIQFRNPALNRVILQALANSGLAAERLELEITESIFLDNSSDTVRMLHRLRKLGVRISLDDFGTGFSSLSYLRTFPFDKIKIDKSFVDDIETESSAAAIVQAIVDLAKALGMETTAEGVEHIEQYERLRAQGCSSIQGYLLGRPVCAVEAASLAFADLEQRAVA